LTAIAVAVPLGVVAIGGAAAGIIFYLRRKPRPKSVDPFEMKPNSNTSIVDDNPLYLTPVGATNPFFEAPS